MKGDVEKLVRIVDMYIGDLTSAITTLKVEGMVVGTLSIPRKSELASIELRLDYVLHQKNRALYLNTEYHESTTIDQDETKQIRNVNDHIS
jgi:hypothetical protein